LKSQSCDIRGHFEAITTKENVTIAAQVIVALLEKMDRLAALAHANLVDVQAIESPYVLFCDRSSDR
jgi:hypothetical protein